MLIVIIFTGCGEVDNNANDYANNAGNNSQNNSGTTTNSSQIKEITPIISQLDFGGNSYGIELSSDKKTAYFANGVDGLAIVDISNIKKPKLISTLQLGKISYRSGDNIVDIRVSKDNKTAYLVGSHDGFYIVNISNKQNPTLVGKFKTDGRARRVRISQNEDIAYIAIGDRDESKSGLTILNISNHANPTRIGKYHAEDSVKGLAISKDDKRAFLADNYDGFKIVDISNKSNPVLIRKIKVTEHNIIAVALSIDEKTAYISDSSDDGLTVVDISNVNNPKVLKRILTPTDANNITVTKNSLYLAPSVGIQFINISNPKNAFREGSYVTPFYTQDIRVSDNEKVAYLANGLAGLVIMDISTHHSPALLSGGVREKDVLGFGLALSSDEKISYQAEGAGGVRVVDVSDVNAPKFLTLFNPQEDIYAERIVLSSDNKYAYIIDSSNHKLLIADITYLANPILLGSYNYKRSQFLNSYSNSCTGITLSKDKKRAYLSIWEHGFIVVDIQDPMNPIEIGGFELIGQYANTLVEGITTSKDGKKVFLSTSSGVLIFDTSNTNKISLISKVESSNYGNDAVATILSHDEKKLYVQDTGLYIVDISDIKNPKRLGKTGGSGAMVLSKDNQRVYFAGASLLVVDVSNANKPKVTGKMVLPGKSVGLVISDNQDVAYMETFQNGLAIMSLKDFK